MIGGPALRIAVVPEQELAAGRREQPTADRLGPGSEHSRRQKADDPRRKRPRPVRERLGSLPALSSPASLVAEALLVRMGSAVRRHFGEGLSSL
jgi:hypothetical protein